MDTPRTIPWTGEYCHAKDEDKCPCNEPHLSAIPTGLPVLIRMQSGRRVFKVTNRAQPTDLFVPAKRGGTRPNPEPVLRVMVENPDGHHNSRPHHARLFDGVGSVLITRADLVKLIADLKEIGQFRDIWALSGAHIDHTIALERAGRLPQGAAHAARQHQARSKA